MGIVFYEVEWISKEDVRAAMKRMKSGAADGPHDISGADFQKYNGDMQSCSNWDTVKQPQHEAMGNSHGSS